MKKYFINRYTIIEILAVIVGALSQPIVACAFIYFDNIYNSNLFKITFSNFKVSILLVALGMIFAGISHILKSLISNMTMNNLREEIFYSIINKPSGEFHTKDSGEYYNFVLRKVDTWQVHYFENFWNILQQIIELILIFSIIFSINILSGFIMLIILTPLVINNLLFPKKIGKTYEEFLSLDSKMVVKLKEFLSGFDVIKFNKGELTFSKKINKYFNATNKCNQKVSFLNNISGICANISVVLSQFIGIGIGITLLINNEIEIGHFIALIQLTSFVNEPIINLINSSVSLGSVKYFHHELRNEIISKNIDYNEEKPKSIKEIKLDRISYKYPGRETPVFCDASYSFLIGKKYLLVGESGSGKSTLIKLIMRIINSYEGNIKFDGQLLSERQIYSIVAIVPQNVFIFEDTIRNNIDLLNKYSDDEVMYAIEKARLEGFVNSKEKGINSIISEEVVQVSGGERVRIALARAFIQNKPILIFDEVLSSLDNETAYEIEEELVSIQNKLVIHIAHKYSDKLKQRYDTVLQICDGRFVVCEVNEHK